MSYIYVIKRFNKRRLFQQRFNNKIQQRVDSTNDQKQHQPSHTLRVTFSLILEPTNQQETETPANQAMKLTVAVKISTTIIHN